MLLLSPLRLLLLLLADVSLGLVNGDASTGDLLLVAAVLCPLEAEEVGDVGEGDEVEDQHDGADAGDSGDQGTAGRVRDGGALGDDAVAGVYGAAVVVAIRVDGDDEAGTEGGVGAQAGEPQDGQEEIQGQDRPGVITGAACGRVLCEDRIQRDYPREDALFEFKRLVLDIRVTM